MDEGRGVNERLARDAAVVQAFPAEPIPLHEEDALPELGRADRGRISSWPRPDHEDVDLADHRRAKDARAISFLCPAREPAVPWEPLTLVEAHEQEGGMLEGAPHILDERSSDVAVDDTMIEGAGQVHHVADRDLVVPDDGPLLDLMDSEDRDLGPVDDRRGQDAALLSKGRDSEGRPENVFEGESLLAGEIREALDLFRKAPEVLLVRV